MYQQPLQRPFARTTHAQSDIQELDELVKRFGRFQTFKLICPRCRGEIDLSKEPVQEHRCRQPISRLRQTAREIKVNGVIVIIGTEATVRQIAAKYPGQKVQMIFV